MWEWKDREEDTEDREGEERPWHRETQRHRRVRQSMAQGLKDTKTISKY
jgi:hypothetical protein